MRWSWTQKSKAQGQTTFKLNFKSFLYKSSFLDSQYANLIMLKHCVSFHFFFLHTHLSLHSTVNPMNFICRKRAFVKMKNPWFSFLLVREFFYKLFILAFVLFVAFRQTTSVFFLLLFIWSKADLPFRSSDQGTLVNIVFFFQCTVYFVLSHPVAKRALWSQNLSGLVCFSLWLGGFMRSQSNVLWGFWW